MWDRRSGGLRRSSAGGVLGQGQEGQMLKQAAPVSSVARGEHKGRSRSGVGGRGVDTAWKREQRPQL